MLSITEIKRQASVLKNFLNQNNAAISQSSCYQAIAKMHGYEDWNTMSAAINKHQESSFIKDDMPVKVFPEANLIMENHGHNGKFGEDAHRLLIVIQNKLKENSLTVQGITRRSLREKWTQERFDNALNQLLNDKFVHHTYDTNKNLILIINPLLFWRGSSEKRLEAVELLNKAIAGVSGYIPTDEFPQNESELILSNYSSINIASIIAFAEEKNKRNQYNKATNLQLCNKFSKF